MSLLSGKKVLVIGIASKLSIAKGIADACYREGAELALTYQNEKLKSRVEKFAEEYGNAATYPCDVSSDQEITLLFEQLKQHWNQVDVIVHSVGFAPADQLEGDFASVTTRQGFAIAHDVSAYSFIAIAKAAKPMLSQSGSLLTLTYHGSRQTLPNYNVMGMAKASLEAGVRYLANSMGPDGIRVNAISAGPIRTLAASGIRSFRKMLAENEKRTPLRRNVTIDEVGNAAAFLCSDLASGVTGEIMYVDAGFNTTAMADFHQVEKG
ncbi:MAG: enoyl-[acyl-carrier-protein] reductase FabI [Gammaproteobacteria bacterium]|nr:MAG: enoyl-[acyl-carrier-protein] reductase FabI [Gammaproteobacteria bacterium]